MWGLGRVGLAWIYAAALAVVLGAVGFWIGGGLGAGIGALAGGFTPLLVEHATRKQEVVDSARTAESPERRYGPAHLLEPGLSVVPFTGRTAELSVLETWCTAPHGGLVRLITGGGGAGKTRLALELCSRISAQGWRCRWVNEKAEGEVVRLERAAAPKAGLLLVVDYSEARTDLDKLLEAAIRDEGQIRVLFLGRHAGDWWERLAAGGGAVRDVISEATPAQMPLPDDLDPRLAAEEMVRQAVPYFAARRGVSAPDAQMVTVAAEDEPRVLDLQAAALVAVLQAQQTSAWSRLRVDTALVLETLLDHEKHYWRGRAEAAGLLTGPDGLSMAQLSQVAAAGCLLGTGTVRDLGGRVPGVTVTEAVALWLRELYPPDRDGTLGSLRPDRLAELHVTQELTGSPQLAEACLTGLEAWQSRRALILLARASADHLDARRLLESSLARFPDVVAGLSAPREVMIAVADAIPYPSLALAPAHAALSARIASTYALGTVERAQWSNIVAVLLGSLGRREEALAASEEAVTIYRDLAPTRPDVFLPNLAMSVNNLSGRLGDLGRREEALAASEEAVTIRRDLATTRPDAFLPDLAMSLVNQSVHLAGLGRREEALAAIEEATSAYRNLATARPDAFLSNLATSLNNQSVHLAGLGRPEEALAAIKEAVTIRRDQATTRPDAFLPDLATSLVNLSARLGDLGRREKALAASEEAVTIYRDLATTRPDAFLPNLAMSVNNLSGRLGDLGRREEALAASEEAVTIYRDLAASRPDAFLPNLATSLNNQSVHLAGLGQPEEALAAIKEAVTIYRDLAASRPMVFADQLAGSLEIQTSVSASLGRQFDAEAKHNEAADVRSQAENDSSPIG